jgi:hypothetical protein
MLAVVAVPAGAVTFSSAGATSLAGGRGADAVKLAVNVTRPGKGSPFSLVTNASRGIDSERASNRFALPLPLAAHCAGRPAGVASPLTGMTKTSKLHVRLESNATEAPSGDTVGF